MGLSVFSEILPLKSVLLHRPGPELEQLTPAHLPRMLFDDIPFLEGARREHDVFAQTLRDRGVEVLYLPDLMSETLGTDRELRGRFLREFIRAAGPIAANCSRQLLRFFDGIEDALELVLTTMRGVTDTELGTAGRHPLAFAVRPEQRFVLDPLPNLYFTRDPFAAIGRGACLCRMEAVTRRRETLYGKYILAHHPRFAGKVPLYYDPALPFNIEGGDLLCLGRGVLAAGVSQRSAPEAVEELAKRVFRDEGSGISKVMAIFIPEIRAYMHLDTVLTQVDHGTFTVHPGILHAFRAFLLTPGAGGSLRVQALEGPLEGILAGCLGLERVTLVRCGGEDAVASQREQWNDGSNTLCVSPGVVVVYDRNSVTNAILRAHGLTTIEVPGSELARGRGGPRCMSLPLRRGARTLRANEDATRPLMQTQSAQHSARIRR